MGAGGRITTRSSHGQAAERRGIVAPNSDLTSE